MRKLRQIERGTLILVAAALLLAGRRVLVTYWDFGIAAGELPQAVRDYRAADLPWTATDLKTAVPERENAAPFLWNAIVALDDALVRGKATPLLPALAPAPTKSNPRIPPFGEGQGWGRGLPPSARLR